MSKELTLAEFNEAIKPVREQYNAKRRELGALQSQFERMVNQITTVNQHPDNLEIDIDKVGEQEYNDLERKHYDEIADIGDIVSDLAYDFDLEWSGSFEEGNNGFWEPSTC